MDTAPLIRPRPAWKRWFLLGLVLYFVVLSFQYFHKITHKENGSALVRWNNQLLGLMDGEDPYKLYTYPNPPIMALILMPFAKVPPLLGAVLWFYAKVGMTFLVWYWVFRLVEAHGPPFPDWAKALTILLSLRPVSGDLTHGNVNLFILFLVVAALYAFHRRHDLGAGVVLALAVACKVTPALFVPYFLWKRSWTTLAGGAVGLALFLVVVPGLVLGFQRNGELLASWSDQMVKPFVLQGKVVYSEHDNQSVPGLVLRLATASPSFSTYVDNVYTPVAYHNLLALSDRAAKWLVKVCMGLFAVIIVWSCRTPTAAPRGWRLAAEFGLVVLGMLLFSERTWKHHCVTLTLPLAVICYYLAACRPDRALRAYLVGSLVASVLLMTSTSTAGFSPLWERAGKLAQVYGAYVWIYLVLAAALVVLLKQPDEPRLAAALEEGPASIPSR